MSPAMVNGYNDPQQNRIGNEKLPESLFRVEKNKQRTGTECVKLI